VRFSRGVAATFTARILLVGLGVASSVLTARALGPAGRGVLATVGALAGIGLQLGNLGLHASNTYQVSRRPDCMGSVWANSVRTAAYLGLALTVAILCAASVFPALLGEVPLPMLLPAALCIPFQLLVLFGLNLLVGMGRVTLFNVLEVGFRTAGLASLVGVLLFLGADLRWVLIASLLITIASAVVVAKILDRMARGPGAGEAKTSFSLFRDSVGYGARSYVAALLAYLIVRSDLLLVNTLRSTAEAGIYSIAVQIADLLYLLPMSIGMVLFPLLSRHGDGDPHFATKVVRHTAFLMLLLCAAAGITAAPVIHLLYGAGFSPAVFALWWLLPGIWAYGVTNPIATHLASAGMPLPAVLVWIPPLILNVVLNLFWIPRWGIAGAAASSSVSYLMVLALHLALWSRTLGGSWTRTLVVTRSDLREMAATAGIPSWW